MAQAYATLANRGVRIGGSLRVRPRAALLDPSVDPISIVEVHVPRANRVEKVVNRARHVRVVGESDALAAVDAMRGVVRYGTGKRASLGRRAAVGKTGTTSDYRDAWFVGMTPQRATSVWVGYPEVARQMETEFNGEPVTGGTFPALIWRAFMRRALQGQPALDWPSAPGVYAVPVSIDARTGRRAASDCPFARVLVLAADRIPDAQSSCPEDLAPVPDLTGMSAARATAAARDAGFRLRLSTRPARAGEDAGAVVVQAPQPLQSAVPGSVVTAEIAVEVPHAVVPRVAGGAAGVSTVARAAARLTAARFRVVLDDEQVAAQPSGTVIGQAPAGGSEAPLGSVVRLLVVGRADGVALAELRGLSLSRARATLARSGVSVVARRVGGRSRPDDVVISTEPERGSLLPRGGSVSLLTAPRSPSAGR
jgi:beta-lactam-binding protein with PASTA domain